MKHLNCVMLMGNVTKDVECKVSKGGSEYARFSLAVNDSWKDKVTGERKNVATFLDIVAFGQHAKYAGNYLRKGTPVLVRGSIQVSKQTSDTGETKVFTSIRADEFIILPNKGGEEGRSAQTNKELDNYFPDTNRIRYGQGEYANRPVPSRNATSAPESLSKEFMGIDPSLDFQFGANVPGGGEAPWDEQ